VDADISGTESNINTSVWNGAWTVFGLVNTGANQIEAIVNGFGDFTGGELETLGMPAPGYALSFDGLDDAVLINSTSGIPSGNAA
jgi:hypothetical protein